MNWYRVESPPPPLCHLSESHQPTHHSPCTLTTLTLSNCLSLSTRLASEDFPVDKQTDKADSNDEDDTKDQNDTRIPISPVAVRVQVNVFTLSLDEGTGLVEERIIDGRHCERFATKIEIRN